MNKKYRSYTKEFKRGALEVLEDSGKSASEIERDMGITSGLLLKWHDRYQVNKNHKELAPSDLAQAQAELKRLRRELKVVREERDILKKAVSIFSRIRE